MRPVVTGSIEDEGSRLNRTPGRTVAAPAGHASWGTRDAELWRWQSWRPTCPPRHRRVQDQTLDDGITCVDARARATRASISCPQTALRWKPRAASPREHPRQGSPCHSHPEGRVDALRGDRQRLQYGRWPITASSSAMPTRSMGVVAARTEASSMGRSTAASVSNPQGRPRGFVNASSVSQAGIQEASATKLGATDRTFTQLLFERLPSACSTHFRASRAH